MSSFISFSPALITKDLNAGEIYQFEIQIHNEAENDIQFKIDYGYLKKSSQGDYELKRSIGDEYQAVSWIETDTKRFIVSNSETKTIDFRLVVPELVESKVYLPVIVFSQESREGGANLGAKAELLSYLMINVKGGEEANAAMNITHFSDSYGSILSPSRVFNISVENSSNFNLTPRGTIKVSSPSGVNITTGISFNEKFKSFLPGEALAEELTWEYGSPNPLELGEYKVELSVIDVGSGEVMDSEAISYFVVPPIYFVAILILLFFLLGVRVGYTKLRSKLMSRKKFERRVRRVAYR